MEAERTALRKLFWGSGLMQRMRNEDRWEIQIEVPHQTSPSELLEMVFGSGPIHKPVPNDVVLFQIAPLVIADEQWGAVVARLAGQPWLRIVDPFLIPDSDLSKIAIFREEC
jgi:hypothetical protein